MGMDDKEYPTGKNGEPEDSSVGAEALCLENTHGLEESFPVSRDPDVESQISRFEGRVFRDMESVEVVQAPTTSSDHETLAPKASFKRDDTSLTPSNKLAEQYASLTAGVGLKGLDAMLGPSKLAEKYASLTAGVGLKGLDAMLGPSKLAEQYASLTAGVGLKGLDAMLGSSKLPEQYASLTAGADLKGLDALLGPSKLAEQYASLTAGVGLKGLDAMLGPSKLPEQYASLTAGVGLKGLDALLGPSKLAEQFASLTSGVGLKGIDAFLGPSKKLEEHYAHFTSGPKMRDFAALVRPAKEMASMFASLKPLPSISGIEALFSSGDSIAKGMARGGSLATMIGSMTSLPSMISIGASLAALGTFQATHHINWDSIRSPSLLEAVGAAAQIIEEDRLSNGSLSVLISRLNVAAHGGVVNEAEPPEAAATMELSTAAQSRDVGHLSDGAKAYLLRLFWIISVLCTYLALQNGVREELCFLQPKIIPNMTAGQMGKAIRAAACDVPLEMLKDYRFVRGESVRLRAAPSTKAETMPIFLGDGDLLELLSSENRDWLQVKVVGQEGVEGWISRRYVRQLTH